MPWLSLVSALYIMTKLAILCDIFYNSRSVWVKGRMQGVVWRRESFLKDAGSSLKKKKTYCIDQTPEGGGKSIIEHQFYQINTG